MTERPSFVRQCDVCSHPARGEIDFLLAEKRKTEELGGKGETLINITLRVHELIDDQFPDEKRVTEASVRTHYKRHRLYPGSPNVGIDREEGIVHWYGRTLPILSKKDQVDIIDTIAFWNLIDQGTKLGLTAFKATTGIRLKRKGEDDTLEQFAKEQLAAGVSEGAKGALVPPDAEGSK